MDVLATDCVRDGVASQHFTPAPWLLAACDFICASSQPAPQPSHRPHPGIFQLFSQTPLAAAETPSDGAVSYLKQKSQKT